MSTQYPDRDSAEHFGRFSANMALDQVGEYKDLAHAIDSYRDNVGDTMKEHGVFAEFGGAALAAFDNEMIRLQNLAKTPNPVWVALNKEYALATKRALAANRALNRANNGEEGCLARPVAQALWSLARDYERSALQALADTNYYL